ncbi:hypothetical protein NK428_002103 [Vibrio navarrensis]|nr:hypothetical protein [Vibrio navarrensis]
MSLKDLLPTGSPQNKIEYLADFIEQKIAEMGSSERPDNLLKNSIFRERYKLSNSPSFPSEQFSGLKKFNYLLGKNKPVAKNWVVEFQDQTSLHTAECASGTYSKYGDFPEVGGGLAKFGCHDGNCVLFQEIVSPRAISTHDNPPEGEKFHAYLRYCQMSGFAKARFGVARLDRHGNVCEIVASKITRQSFTYQIVEEWLELPSDLSKGSSNPNDQMKLVFFVEAPSGARLGVEATGVYFGKNNQIPKSTLIGNGVEFRLPSPITDSTFHCPTPIGTYSPEKHLCFAVYDNDLSRYAFNARLAEFSLTTDGQIEVSNIGNVDSDSVICGINEQNLEINYFSFVDPLSA